MYRAYEAYIYVNDTWFSELWIDTHYEEKHADSINDELIKRLVSLLKFRRYEPDTIDEDGFRYFKSNLSFEGKGYRLIWLIPPDENYIGVRNAFRRKT